MNRSPTILLLIAALTLALAFGCSKSSSAGGSVKGDRAAVTPVTVATVILLVEFANQRRAQGANAKDAMLQAGQVRLRPILMTSFTLILGILPIAIGSGAGAESRRPMGVAILGGMFTSTFLTLVIIPVVYTLFSDVGDKVLHRKKHLEAIRATA